ncbi:hypothetical protein Pelo_6292 [Pelomyxa schiedti]|nr:hypothetical protein Pelo_6292 [Pelomyxa schiedti]
MDFPLQGNGNRNDTSAFFQGTPPSKRRHTRMVSYSPPQNESDASMPQTQPPPPSALSSQCVLTEQQFQLLQQLQHQQPTSQSQQHQLQILQQHLQLHLQSQQPSQSTPSQQPPTQPQQQNKSPSTAVSTSTTSSESRENPDVLRSLILSQPCCIAPSPPTVTLSTSKVFKFRVFQMYITIHPEWAKRYTEDEIMRAGLSAKTRKEDDPTVDLPSCHCSAGKRVVEIGISSREIFGPTRTSEGFLKFTFDTCKTNCSSSRDHLKSRVILVIDELPHTQALTSPPFIIYAREKQKKKDIVNAVLHTEATPQPDQAWWKLMESADTGKKIVPDTTFAAQSKVVIRLFSTTLTWLEMEDLTQHFLPLMKRLTGFIDFRCKTFPGFVVSFSYFDTIENANASSAVIARYINNEEGYNNPYNCNLSENGVAVMLAVCTSY